MGVTGREVRLAAALVRWVAIMSVLVLVACTPPAGPAPEAAGSAREANVGAAHPVVAAARPRSCDPTFRATSGVVFNDPSGERAEQMRIVAQLVRLINCTPASNPDGSRAELRLTTYSLSYVPVRRSLIAAARRGVSVRVLVNSHSDRSPVWSEVVDALGTDTSAASFALTCWQGCLRPRQPPEAGGPTAWFSARATSAQSRTAVFTDHSRAGRAPITSWSWDFGDGTSAVGPGPHRKRYRGQGIYTVTLTVRDATGSAHRSSGDVTIPDALEPLYPAMHAKVLISSTVGTGSATRRWVSAYGSGNPTYTQARRGFNNLNISVGDRALYDSFDRYFDDLVAGSQGYLLGGGNSRTVATPGSARNGAPPTTVHFLPRDSGELPLEVLRSIRCRYRQDGRARRTRVRISMFALSRVDIGAELWRLAFERGCIVDLVHSTVTQRLRGPDGSWVRDEEGEPLPWGPADCLSTPPARGSAAGGARARDPLDDPAGMCAGGTLGGRVAGSQPGTWIDRVSAQTGGRLTVTAACPVVTRFDQLLGVWVFACRASSWFTHEKVLLVDGMVRGKVQKYVMTGSANWTATGLHANDEVVTELFDAPAVHDAYLRAHRREKTVFTRASPATS